MAFVYVQVPHSAQQSSTRSWLLSSLSHMKLVTCSSSSLFSDVSRPDGGKFLGKYGSPSSASFGSLKLTLLWQLCDENLLKIIQGLKTRKSCWHKAFFNFEKSFHSAWQNFGFFQVLASWTHFPGDLSFKIAQLIF